MSVATQRSAAGPTGTAPYWAEELPGGHARFRAKIGGLHCSLCTGTIEKALGRKPGVEKVAVSLTHEQALVDYDPARVRPEELLETLRDIGYTIWDPRKVRPYEEEEAERGLLMRTGEAFRAFRSVSHVVLDKTGTLSEGRPTVHAVEALGDPDEVLAVAAAAEAASEHPLGQAIVDALDRGLDVPAVDDFEAVPGHGVAVRLGDEPVLVGRPGFVAEQGIDLTPLAERIAAEEAAGRTVVAVARAGRLLGAITLGDELRADAAAVGIDSVRVHAGVLPDQKAAIVRELQGRGARVAMVGDGINDAPALMQADVGVAMGAGTDIAIESADVIILGNRLGAILEARGISRRSYRKTEQNVMLAFLFNGIGIPVAATGLVYPVWAMVAMALSVTTIFLNSLRGRPALFFDALASVGRPAPAADAEARAA